jgi:hypothetical protein
VVLAVKIISGCRLMWAKMAHWLTCHFAGIGFGYMNNEEQWARLVSGEAGMLPCIACQRTLERNAAVAAYQKLLTETSLNQRLEVFSELETSFPACKAAAEESRKNEDAERPGFALEMAAQFGASFAFIDEGLIVMREDDMVGMMSVLGFRTSAEFVEIKAEKARGEVEVRAPKNGDF